jgi:hypothetical protein
VASITTSGVITAYPFTSSDPVTGAITAGLDGALWFVLGNSIARSTTSGTITEYPVPTRNAGLIDITAGPDGALWFTEERGNKIGRITTSGVITEYPLSSSSPYFVGPLGITTGPDGALWFTVSEGLGRITTAGVMTAYLFTGPISAHHSAAGITTGPDGELWFTTSPSSIGEGVFVSANLSAAPSSSSYAMNVDFMGSGFGPNELVHVYEAGIGSALTASGTTNSVGSFSAEGRVSQAIQGDRVFLGKGQASGKIGAASFIMIPDVFLSPTTGPVGTAVTVTGYGFAEFQTESIFWDNSTDMLGSAMTNFRGSFTVSSAFTFAVPAGAAPGAHMVLVESEAGQYSATFTVE